MAGLKKQVRAQSGGVALSSKGGLKDAAAVLKAGGVVMHATETCYGLAADIFNPKAVEKIYAIKRMDHAKPVSIMVRGLDEAQKYARFNKMVLDLAKKYWPGPLTIILPRKKALPAFLNRGHKTVGLRCPDSAVAQKLIKANGGPLVTTSANISGKKEVYKVQDYIRQTGKSLRKKDGIAGNNDPDLIIDDGLIVKNPPSTIVAFEKGRLKMIREGDLWIKILKQYGGNGLLS